MRPFPGPGGRIQVSVDGGSEPVFTWDDRELIYREDAASAGRLIAAAIQTAPTFEVTARTPLFDVTNYVGAVDHANYDVSPDGRSFVAANWPRCTAVQIPLPAYSPNTAGWLLASPSAWNWVTTMYRSCHTSASVADRRSDARSIMAPLVRTAASLSRPRRTLRAPRGGTTSRRPFDWNVFGVGTPMRIPRPSGRRDWPKLRRCGKWKKVGWRQVPHSATASEAPGEQPMVRALASHHTC